MEESLEIAETLKVLNTISLEPKANTMLKSKPQDESIVANLRQSKKMVKLALDSYVGKLRKDMEYNLERDNRTELNKIFLVYASLDMQSQA